MITLSSIEKGLAAHIPEMIPGRGLTLVQVNAAGQQQQNDERLGQ